MLAIFLATRYDLFQLRRCSLHEPRPYLAFFDVRPAVRRWAMNSHDPLFFLPAPRVFRASGRRRYLFPLLPPSLGRGGIRFERLANGALAFFLTPCFLSRASVRTRRRGFLSLVLSSCTYAVDQRRVCGVHTPLSTSQRPLWKVRLSCTFFFAFRFRECIPLAYVDRGFDLGIPYKSGSVRSLLCLDTMELIIGQRKAKGKGKGEMLLVNRMIYGVGTGVGRAICEMR